MSKLITMFNLTYAAQESELHIHPDFVYNVQSGDDLDELPCITLQRVDGVRKAALLAGTKRWSDKYRATISMYEVKTYGPGELALLISTYGFLNPDLAVQHARQWLLDGTELDTPYRLDLTDLRADPAVMAGL